MNSAIEGLAIALEATSLSSQLRQSMWVYPIVNALHIVGIALLIGATTLLDLRLLGWRKAVSVSTVAALATPIATAGMVLTILAGLGLFIARPLDYVFNELFQIKLVLLLVALANLVLLVRSSSWQHAMNDELIPTAVKAAAAVSLLLWLAVLFAGRMIGYR